MKLTTLTAVAAVGVLAACGPKAETKSTDAGTKTSATAPSDGMASTTSTSQVGKVVNGTGIVTAVDEKAGTITLDHDAIADAGWPAMTMAFNAPAEIIAKSKVGEKVAFELRIVDMGGEITAIKPR